MGCGTSSDGGALHSLSFPPSSLRGQQRFYTWSDVAQHASAVSAWTVIDGRVLDVTEFSARHPGGAELLELAAWGKDATRHFSTAPTHADPFSHAHSAAARETMQDMQIGLVVAEGDPRAGRLLVDVEAEERHRHQQAGNAYGGAGGGAPLRAQALLRIKQVQRAGQEAEAVAAAASHASSAAPLHPAHPPLVLQAFSGADVATHATQQDCWTVAMDGQVFNLTSLVNPAAAMAKTAAATAAATRSRSSSRSASPAPPPLLDWRQLAGKNSDAYLKATLTPDQIANLLPPLQVGYLHGHSVQAEDAGRLPGAHSHPNPHARSVGSSPVLTGRPGLSAAALASAALDGIADDGLTVAAAEGLLASPSPLRYLWTLKDRRDLTPDSVLLTFTPLIDPRSIESWCARRSIVERELQQQYPVEYSRQALRPLLGQHVSVEIPLELPLENPAERLERERENRPLDVPFRMQRSYTPLEAGPAQLGSVASNPRPTMSLAVKSYPLATPPAPGSSYMHSLDMGDTIVTTGARGGRFDFEAAASSASYDVWVALVAGSGVSAVYAIVKELLARIAKANAANDAVGAVTSAAAVVAATATLDKENNNNPARQSSPPAAHSPSSAASSTATTTTATATGSPLVPGPMSESIAGGLGGGGRGSVFSTVGGSAFAPTASAAAPSAQRLRASSAADSSAPAARDPLPPGAPCRRVVLVCCNRTEEDILLGAELDALVEAHSQYFQVFHVLSRPIFSPKHSSFTGRLNADVLRFVIPACVQPSGMSTASISLSGGGGEAHLPPINVGALLAGGPGAGLPGSRPRSPSSAYPQAQQQQQQVRQSDFTARLHAAHVAAGLYPGGGGGGAAGSTHASPLLLPMVGAGTLPSLPSSCPGSRPRSPSRFTFNIPFSRPSRSPLLASAPPPPVVVPPIAGLAVTQLSRGVSGATGAAAAAAPSPNLPTPGVQDLLHVPEGLHDAGEQALAAAASSSSQLSPPARSAAMGPAASAGGVEAALAAQQRLVINATGGGGGGGTGTGGIAPPLSLHPSARQHSGSVFLPATARSTGLALVCGPLEFAQDTLALLVRFGFKRGVGNLGGKDVHVF